MPRISGLGTGEVKLANMAVGSVDNSKLAVGSVDNSKQVFFESSQIVPPVSAIVSAAHGFGQKPKWYQVVMQFIAAANGYNVGDEVDITSCVPTTSAGFAGTTSCDAVSVYLSAGGINYAVFDRTTTSFVAMSTANFRLIMRAWK